MTLGRLPQSGRLCESPEITGRLNSESVAAHRRRTRTGLRRLGQQAAPLAIELIVSSRRTRFQ
jgi:hypothetical protein